MADDVVNPNPVPTNPNQPAPGVTPDGYTDGPHPTPEGTPENVNTGAAPAVDEPGTTPPPDQPAPADQPAQPADGSGVQTTDDLR